MASTTGQSQQPNWLSSEENVSVAVKSNTSGFIRFAGKTFSAGGEMKRFEADCNKEGDWFVFDNDACYCVAGPMDEEKAIDMAIEMNQPLKVEISPLDTQRGEE